MSLLPTKSRPLPGEMSRPLISPFVSVIIRSYNRLPYILELIEKCLNQDYDNYEVVIIDQSDKAQWEEYEEALNSLDNKVRVIRSKPYGSAAAKNLGVAVSKGDIVLLMDDDDLPIGKDWITSHARHYKDPCCIGVSGRCLNRINDSGPSKNVQRVYDRCLTYSFFLGSRGFCSIDKVKKPVQWLHGINASIRRSYVLKLGGWYPFVANFDEHSFCFKLQKEKKPGEYLMYDPKPQILRRFDIPGGLEKRYIPLTRILNNQLRFYHRVVSEYFPLRFYGLYPFFMFYIFRHTIRWFRKHSYYTNTIWMRWFGKKQGQRFYFLQEFVKYPFLVLRALVEKKPKWDGELTTPKGEHLEVRDVSLA